MPKFRYSLDTGSNWVVVDEDLPYNIPAQAGDTVWVEPIGATAVRLPQQPNLSALSLSATTGTVGEAATINIVGATSGSTITGTVPDGMTLNSGARTISGTPTLAGTYDFALTETLAESLNSPRVTDLTITISEAEPSGDINAPVLTITSQTTYPPPVLVDLDETVAEGDVFQFQASSSVTFGTTSIDVDVTLDAATISGSGITIPGLSAIASPAQTYSRARVRRGAASSPWSSIVKHGDTVAPTITSSNPSGSYDEGVPLSGTLTANEAVRWSVSGPDAGAVTINAETGAWTLEPTVFFTKASYDFSFFADDYAGNIATQVVAFTILEVDVTAPVLSLPTDTATNDVSMSGTVSTTEGNGTLFWYISTSATPPTIANLKAGTGAASFGSQAVTASGVQNIIGSGLTPSTAYFTHYLHTDAAGNNSNIATADGFTTAAADPFPNVNLALRIEPDDLSTLFQQTSGTTAVAAAGDPVGYVGDKSGAGYHLTAPGNDTTRPTYRTTGKPHIEFDGTNDYIRRLSSLGLFNSANGFTFAIAMGTTASVAPAGAAPFSEGNTVITAPLMMPLFSLATTDDVRQNVRGDSGSYVATTPTTPTLSANGFNGTNRVFIGTYDPATRTLTLYQDSATTASGTAVYNAAVLPMTIDQFTLGAHGRAGGASLFMAYRLYAFAAWRDIKDSTDRAAILTHMQSKLP